MSVLKSEMKNEKFFLNGFYKVCISTMPNLAFGLDIMFGLINAIIVGLIVVGFSGGVYVLNTFNHKLMSPIFVSIAYGIGAVALVSVCYMIIVFCMFTGLCRCKKLQKLI